MFQHDDDVDDDDGNNDFDDDDDQAFLRTEVDIRQGKGPRM